MQPTVPVLRLLPRHVVPSVEQEALPVSCDNSSLVQGVRVINRAKTLAIAA